MQVKENPIVRPAPKNYSGSEMIKEPGIYQFRSSEEYLVIPKSCRWSDCVLYAHNGITVNGDFSTVMNWTKVNGTITINANGTWAINKNPDPPFDEFPIKTRPTEPGLYIANCGGRYLYEVLDNTGKYRYKYVDQDNSASYHWQNSGDFSGWRKFEGSITYP